MAEPLSQQKAPYAVGPVADDARDAQPLATNSQQCAFEDIRLHIGDALQLQGASGGDRYYVKLVGYLPGGSVLVTTPTRAGRVLLMREGQSFIARAFSGRSAFAFNTVVHRVCNVPYPYLHLQFPKLVEGVAIRREERIRLRVSASVTVAGATEPATAVIEDLSPSGARIAARELLADKGEKLQLSFRLKFDQDYASFASGVIVRSVRNDQRGAEGGELQVMHGVEFVGMQPNERLLLRTLILQRIAEGRRQEPAAQ